MKLLLFTVFIGIYMLIELITGIISDSISLQTDAFHMISDFIALSIASYSEYISKKGTENIRYSFGLKRAEILGGFFNSSFLLINLFWLLRENIEKFVELSQNPENKILEGSINEVITVASIGLIINIVGVLLFHHHHSHGDSDSDHNHLAVSLHLIADLLGSIVIVISTVIIKLTTTKYRFMLDPIGSTLIVVLLFPVALKSLFRSGRLLMQKSPRGLDIEKLRRDILNVDGVEDVHELHIWCVDSNVTIAGMHIKSKKRVMRKVKDILHEYNIHSSTIQLEKKECPEPSCRTCCNDKKCCN